MPKIMLWTCDHCRAEEKSDSLPTGWVTARITEESERYSHNDNDEGKEFIWCRNCWYSFKNPVPLKAVERA